MTKTDTKRSSVININVYLFLAAYALIALVGILITKSPSYGALNWYLSFVWSLYFPIAIISIGYVTFFSSHVKLSEFTGSTNKKVLVMIPTVCRRNILPALIRVIDSVLKYAPRTLHDFQIDVITDEGAEGIEELRKKYASEDTVNVIVVPEDYHTPNNTKYKARANQFAADRRKERGENTKDVYIYHLDDDTHVDKTTIASIAEFAEKHHEKYYLAQGILTFPHELCSSSFVRYADAIRPLDDLVRFSLFTGTLGTPMAGLHGEHLLIRADIEEEIGWDFGDTIVEDAYFALVFSSKYPGRSRSLNSYSFGASPSCIRDLIKQRRRWSSGLIALILNRDMPLKTRIPLMYSVFCWVLGPFQFVGLALAVSYLTGIKNTSPVAIWIVFLWAFNFAFFIWQYIEGYKMNMQVSKYVRRKRYTLLSVTLHKPQVKLRKYKRYFIPIIVFPVIYAISAIEGFAALLGMKRFIQGNKVFDVIAKET